MEKPDQRDYDFSSQEGYDQYDAAVAKYNRQQEDPKIGTELADKIEGAVGFVGEQASKIPFIRTGLQFLGGSVKTIDNVMTQDQGPGGMIYRTYKNVKSASEEGFGDLAENVGVDRRYGSFFGGELIDTAVTAGTGAIAKRAINVVDKLPPGGMSQQLATAGVTPMGLAPSNGSITLRPQVMELTIKNPDNLARGAAKGWAEGPEFGGSMTKWRNRRMELREQMRNPSGLTANRRQKNKNKSLITAYNDVSTGPTRLVDNPLAYDKDPFKKVSSLEKRNMEQHHLFPKQESYQFVERMLKLGDEDDVLNLMIFAEEVDASMGGRLVNMLNMERQPHTILHNSRKAIEDGRQLKSLEMKNLVENAKSSDELMGLFKTYLETNIKPSKDEAFALNNLYEIAKKQGKHEEMYKALKNKGR